MPAEVDKIVDALKNKKMSKQRKYAIAWSTYNKMKKKRKKKSR